MAAPLRFKPYIPKSQRPLKLEQTAPAPETHEQDLTSLPACSNNLSSQNLMEEFGLDGMLSSLHSMDQYSGSNTDGEIAQDLAGNLSIPANQLALPVEPILHGDQNQEMRDRKADKMFPMLIAPTPATTTFGSTTGQQVADNVAEQTGFIESGAATVMRSPDQSTHGIDLCGVDRDTSLSPLASSTSASAITILGSPSPEDRPGDDKGFQRQGFAIISEQTKRLLSDGQDDDDVNNQAEVKRPRLSSTARCGALLHQPGTRNVASTPVDNVDVAYDESRHHLSSTRHNCDGSNGTCGETSLAVDARAHCPKPIHSTVDQNGGPINPPTVQASQCGSCLIFRSALLEALYLLQSPPSEDNTCHTQPEHNILKWRYDLRRRPETPQSGCKEASNKDSLSCMDRQFSQTDNHAISNINENDDSLSTNGGSGNVSGQRRSWTPLEKRRLRAWKMEDKSESWIALKLDRTASAVKQQWRKMN